MTKAKKYSWLLWLLLVAAVVIVASKSYKSDRLPVEVRTIETGSGWGYQIWVDHKVFINQPTIPAVSGRQSFATREQALLVGNKALAKIKQGKMPVITLNELRRWQIVDTNGVVALQQ